MKFFYAPNACSTGIHVLLEELGLDYDQQALDLRAGEQRQEAYLSVNRKGKVPALLLDDGRLLTEFGAIAFWLAQTHPEAGLLPEDLDMQIRTRELLDYMVATVHMRGYAFIFAPQKFVADESAQAALRAHGAQVVQAGLQDLSRALGERDYLLGTFSIADAALFYLTHWATAFSIGMPDNLKAFYARMMQRPAVARALALQGQLAA